MNIRDSDGGKVDCEPISWSILCHIHGNRLVVERMKLKHCHSIFVGNTQMLVEFQNSFTAEMFSGITRCKKSKAYAVAFPATEAKGTHSDLVVN